MIDDDSPEIIARIKAHLAEREINLTDLAHAMTRNEYHIRRESLYGYLDGVTRLNRHFLETLATVFDVPLSDLVTGSEYNELPEFPKRYSKITSKKVNTLPTLPASGSWAAQKHYAITGINLVLNMHRLSPLSDYCPECVKQKAPCDTTVTLHALLKGLKDL